MGESMYFKKKSSSLPASTPASKSVSWRRPFPEQNTQIQSKSDDKDEQAYQRRPPSNAMSRLISSLDLPYAMKPIQTKLTVGAPGDKYEQEADQVAEQVMSMPDTATQQPVQREAAAEEEEVQTKPIADSMLPASTSASKSVSWRRPFPEQSTQIQSKSDDRADKQAYQRRPPSDAMSRLDSSLDLPYAMKPIQTKLTVGAPGDQYEQEANRVADQVMSMGDSAIQPPVQRESMPEEEEVQTKPIAASITPLVQREMAPEEDMKAKDLAFIQLEVMPEEELQTKPLTTGRLQREVMPGEEEAVRTKPLNASIQREEMLEEEPVQTKLSLWQARDDSLQAGSSIESQLSSSKGRGNPLPDDVRSFMEPRFGADFSQVQVHTSNESVQMNQELSAQAFTHGSDIYFGAGKSPTNSDLTAHELTHVLQQTEASQINTSASFTLQREVTQGGEAQAKPLTSNVISVPERPENVPRNIGSWAYSTDGSVTTSNINTFQELTRGKTVFKYDPDAPKSNIAFLKKAENEAFIAQVKAALTDPAMNDSSRTTFDKAAQEVMYAGAIASLNFTSDPPGGSTKGVLGGMNSKGLEGSGWQALSGSLMLAAALGTEAKAFLKSLQLSVKVSRTLSQQAAEELVQKYGVGMLDQLHKRGMIGPYASFKIFTRGVGGQYQAHHIVEASVLRHLGYDTELAPVRLFWV